MRHTAQATGKFGEQIIVDYLLARGCELLEKNWRWKKAEVDIIAKENHILLFVEVKTRSSSNLFELPEVVTIKKQQLLMDAAEAYCELMNINTEIRMDIAVVIGDRTSHTIKYLEAAF